MVIIVPGKRFTLKGICRERHQALINAIKHFAYTSIYNTERQFTVHGKGAEYYY